MNIDVVQDLTFALNAQNTVQLAVLSALVEMTKLMPSHNRTDLLAELQKLVEAAGRANDAVEQFTKSAKRDSTDGR